MEIEIKWQKPILVARHNKLYIRDNRIPRHLKRKPGVYFFSREYGKTKKFREPFYIGETKSIRSRLRKHLQSAKLCDALRGIKIEGFKTLKQGKRYFHFGYYVGKPGQSAKKCLAIVQRFMIREAVSRGIPLLNSQLTVIKTHNLLFRGRASNRVVFPKRTSVERT